MRLNKLSLPIVSSRKDTLVRWEGNARQPDIKVDSQEWFTWLEEAIAFRMVYFPGSGAEEVQFNVRPETRRNGRIYWQSWKSIKGRAVKKYIGPSSKVTHEKLIETGEWFYQQVVANESVDQQLVKTIKGLLVTMEDLLSHCSEPEITEQAQVQMKRARKMIK